VKHINELGEETNTLPFDTVDEMIEYAKYPVFVHYAHPEPKPEYCIHDMYEMMQHAMDLWDTSTANKDLTRTLTQLRNSPPPHKHRMH
jgi:hypothetical protein